MPRILISTTVRWPSAARLAGAFAACGCAVDALFPEDHPLAASRYPAARHRYSALRPLRALRCAIERSGPDLVVACDDRAVAHLLQLHAQAPKPMRELIERSLGDPRAYEQLLSRPRFIRAARDAGIAAPPTVALEGEHDFEAALGETDLPAVLKLDASWGGDGVAVVQTRDEAKSAFARLANPPSRLRSLVRWARRGDAHHLLAALDPPRPTLSLQRHVTGRPATTSFACWQGEMIAANHFDVLQSDGARGPASVVKRVDDPDMDRAARKLARRFSLSGLHGLDYVRDEAGIAHLIEINPRATPTGHLAFGGGRDLVAALVGHVATAAPAERPTVPTGDLVALFPQEWSRDRASPWLGAAVHDVPWDDPRLIDACLIAVPAAPARPAAIPAAPILNGR
jgi:ATP-grasp domain